MDKLLYSGFNSPLGTVLIAGTSKGICLVRFSNISETEFIEILKNRFREEVVRDDKVFKDPGKSLIDYFKGRQINFEFPLDLSTGTKFQRKVWQKVKEIPYGELRSYKWISQLIGNAHASRAVGNAVGKNPVAPIIPCHRVICSNGDLGGYSSGIAIKKRLLKLEGINWKNLRISPSF